MKKEYGSEFWEVPIKNTNNELFIENTKWFVSGTSALEFIILDIKKNNKIRKAALPSFCCECMIKPFIKNNIEVIFYPVYLDSNNNLVCDYSSIEKCDIHLLISYFGYNKQKIIGKASGIIIRDTTHSIFSKEYHDADYYFGSLRKWAGFWTGGYAFTYKKWNNIKKIELVDEFYLNLRKNAMEEKERYLISKTTSKEYLNKFYEAEEYLDNCNIVSGCERDIELVKNLDINFIKKQRRKNAEILMKDLKEFIIFDKLEENDCPLFVPIIVETNLRNDLRKYLIENNIYCPIHWEETEFHNLDNITKRLYNEGLSIICDQRYTEEDMRIISRKIKEFLKLEDKLC